ncbi:MAG: 23S rRNA (guanosine(2251)-2'-O)-methyltransferase RlmB [Bacteroidota bacterium]
MGKGNQIYGLHSVIEALEAGKEIDKILIRKDNSHGKLADVRRLAKETAIPLQWVPEQRLYKMVGDVNHQGIVALLSNISYQPLEELIMRLQGEGKKPFLIMLDGITDVRNFGAIARTAECMGAHAVIIPTHGSASVQADAIKTSAGALNHLPVCREQNLVDSLMLMQAYGIEAVALTEKADSALFDMDLSGPLCIIMGSEERGISKQLLRRTPHLAAIPMQGQISSLNVSVAAGMAILEAVRQRA